MRAAATGASGGNCLSQHRGWHSLPRSAGRDNAEAADENSDQPTIWIELGGQLQKLDETQQSFSPSFMPSVTQANLLSALDVQRSSTYALDGEGKISFQPDGSDWVFSASVQYGRSRRNRASPSADGKQNRSCNLNFPPPNSALHAGPKYYYPSQHVGFADRELKQSETHATIDFQAGKDVGLDCSAARAHLS